jgi:GH24 family phage-related lysozyme (muramidase)
MHQSVLDVFFGFSKAFEGHVNHLYLDIKGLVTTGIGNLVDPVEAACRLPWKLPDGSLAGDDEIRRQWQALKGRQDLRHLHFKYAAGLTTIRLTDADIDALVVGKLLENERYMRKTFKDWDSWPADAQLACSSMAWAVGAGFTAKFTNFTTFAVKQDWRNAKLCCDIRTDNNPGVVPRNAANHLCFDNAATVREKGLDPSVLYWPQVAPQSVAKPPETGITDADRAAVLAGQRERDQAGIDAARLEEMAEAGMASSRDTSREDPTV